MYEREEERSDQDGKAVSIPLQSHHADAAKQVFLKQRSSDDRREHQQEVAQRIGGRREIRRGEGAGQEQRDQGDDHRKDHHPARAQDIITDHGLCRHRRDRFPADLALCLRLEEAAYQQPADQHAHQHGDLAERGDGADVPCSDCKGISDGKHGERYDQ